MYSGLKGCREAKNAQPKPHFYQAAPPTCAPPHPAMPGAKKKTPLRNNNKTAATAGVGRVQLNFQTAGRDQRWKSIFCSNTRPASIIQRRVPLGDLSLSPSLPLRLSFTPTLSDSLALSSRPSPSLASFVAHDGFRIFFIYLFFPSLALEMFEMFSLPLSHSPRLFLHASQLARRKGGGGIIWRIC